VARLVILAGERPRAVSKNLAAVAAVMAFPRETAANRTEIARMQNEIATGAQRRRRRLHQPD